MSLLFRTAFYKNEKCPVRKKYPAAQYLAQMCHRDFCPHAPKSWSNYVVWDLLILQPRRVLWQGRYTGGICRPFSSQLFPPIFKDVVHFRKRALTDGEVSIPRVLKIKVKLIKARFYLVDF